MSAARAEVFRPKTEDLLGLGAALAIAAHVLLVLALTLGVNWRTHPPEVAEAEVWSEVPVAAAPRAEAPPPPPPEPEPVIPKAEEPPPPPPEVEPPEAELAQAPQPKPVPKPKPAPKKELPPKKEPKPKKAKEPVETVVPDKRVAARKPAVTPPVPPSMTSAEREAQRKLNLQRMMSELGGMGQAPKSGGSSANYAGRVRDRIWPNIKFGGVVNGNPTAFVEIRCAPDGRILSRRLLDSSGVPEWDNAVLRAIDGTESLPLDENGRLPHHLFEIGFSPKDR